ncbi:nuclear transport factor 2 family protein [Pseudonocardia kujensis]|uniref:nuclear transport factor 2 family protein n=1 Tax=Pseudonocardia kujensis TaxID=1128675 RepID=UPI001E3E6976|nr:nuclear transport factor 2 family protein [Pseudonocardia kujensis]MCE0767606.1 nuclear transport factor 2 family protein [Pseudonocardia kujensis]
MTSLSVEDRLLIHDLIAHYSRGLDTQRRDEFLGVFWSDSVLDSSLAGGEFVGHDGIAEWYDHVHSEPDFEPFLWGQHRPANVIIEASGADAAHVWCQFELLTRLDGVPRIAAYGEYDDTVTKRAGEWRFSRRIIRIAANAATPTGAS